jgi:uroporphyrinogen III methyltransferase/synthase
MESPANGRRAGRVDLIGAGPGDPRYITVRAVECLAAADVVLYDYLVNPALLTHTRSDAELICLGQHGRTRLWTQDEINAHLIAEAQAGRRVARLKSGDPTIFARVAEELDALVAAGIEFEIVPGVTAAIGVGSCAGIPLTHRDFASAVAFVTGHEEAGKDVTALDYAALARFSGTLVFYMGVTTARTWTTELIAAGKAGDTPAAIVRRCSFSDQQTISCRLDEVADRLEQPKKMRPPVIVVVGDVVQCAERYRWFENRPLFGQTIVVTRPKAQCAGLADPLMELGAEVLLQPAIEIGPPDDWTHVDNAIDKLSDFEWLVFSSANGVQMFLDRVMTLGDLRTLGSVKLAGIGPGTADALAAYHLRADLVPSEYRAESLAAAVAGTGSIAGVRVLLVRASRGREVLADDLAKAGARVEQVVVYESRDVLVADEAIHQRLRQGTVDWITVTSSAIARSLATLFANDLHRAKLASISPITSATLRELGYAPTVEATEYTMQGVVEAIRSYASR